MASSTSSAPSVTGSCATTCFDRNTEPRYEELRADQKAISDQVSAMVNGQKKFAGVSKARVMEDDYPIELRKESLRKLRWWIRSASILRII